MYNTGTQDPYSTLGRPEKRKKEVLVSSSANDSLSSPVRSNFELKSDFHPVSEFNVTETETETKIDLGSTEKSTDPNPAVSESESTTKAKDEVEVILLEENTSLKEENDTLKLNSNVDHADKNVPSVGDMSDQGESNEISVSIIENPSASEEGKERMDADTAKENTVDMSCEVIENVNTTKEESSELDINRMETKIKVILK